jgi:hypothetical protein
MDVIHTVGSLFTKGKSKNPIAKDPVTNMDFDISAATPNITFCG